MGNNSATSAEAQMKIRKPVEQVFQALDGLKGWLEHNLNLNLILDRFPKEVGKHGN
jgi:hypothetical protein